MTEIIQVFEDSKYTLVLASNYLPGYLLFELIEFTTSMQFTLSFKLLFAFMAGVLITEWFYEWISLCMNLIFNRKNPQMYKNFLKIMSPVRILRQLSKIEDDKLLAEIKTSGYPQSMALTCSMGSIGWLLVFFTLLTWKGIFLVLIGIPILVAIKTFVRALYKEEVEFIKSYTIFLALLVVFIISVVLIEPRQESEIIFIVSENVLIENVKIAIENVYILMIGLYFIFVGSSYYFNDIKKAEKDIFKTVGD